jgi:hypothetical protein
MLCTSTALASWRPPSSTAEASTPPSADAAPPDEFPQAQAMDPSAPTANQRAHARPLRTPPSGAGLELRPDRAARLSGVASARVRTYRRIGSMPIHAHGLLSSSDRTQ